MKDYYKLLRINHYIKNLIIFLPAILSGNFFTEHARSYIIGFFVFSFASSIIYIINDIRDVDLDRNHPTKCLRPIASGRISLKGAIMTIVLLSVLSVCLVIYSRQEFRIMIDIPAVYIIINLGYSLGLKNIPLLDVVILSAGYLLRLQYGATIVNAGVSKWMFLTMMAASFFMAFGKRRGELMRFGDTKRESLKGYTLEFLDRAVAISLAMTFIFYALMCEDTHSSVAQLGGTCYGAFLLSLLLDFGI